MDGTEWTPWSPEADDAQGGVCIPAQSMGSKVQVNSLQSW